MNKQQLDFLVKLKNFSILRKEVISFKYNYKILNLVKFFYKEGLIQSFFVLKDDIFVNIRFFYENSELSSLKIVSKPSYKKYLKHKNISQLNSSKQILCFSTDKGIVGLTDCKKNNLGGKLLFIN